MLTRFARATGAITLAAACCLLLLPGTAGAAPGAGTPLRRDCLRHSVAVTPGSTVEVLTHLENDCGRRAWITIDYRAEGPCRHQLTVTLRVPMVPVDVVAFYDSPCAGHYVLRQNLIMAGRHLAQDTTEFDAPG